MRSLAAAALLAAFVLAPLRARAGALDDARGATRDSSLAFDGSTARPEAVKAGLPAGEDRELEAPKPNPWLAEEHVVGGVTVGLVGALVGSLWGFPGAAIGLLVGALIGYGVSLLKA